MSRDITVVCWNFENNGAGNADKRWRANEILALLQPNLLLRQEMWDADAHGNSILHDQANRLGLHPWLGERSCTALFVDQQLFTTDREWREAGPAWKLPPTGLTLRYRPAGPEAMPLAVVSYHLNYCSPSGRLAEAEELSAWADKKWTTPHGTTVRMPALMGGDHNSYPVPRAGNELPLPQLEAIADQPHRLHRSHTGTDGTRVMDTRPDETLRTAGLEDFAWHWATAEHGDPAALTRTVNASETHGPVSRIDRFYATEELLPALSKFDVIEVDPEISDHHILRAVLDADTLGDILNSHART
ncbi:MAG TPA: endonuclease/exonuclease/phosphatase family protein [Streptomyces sp.]|jgi:endonuclease/exonuclease/phosphatase family metal-dependent hydrolase|nr:endonuclease/exonuclease/phosphatase family protein [Streptomyces sp.]